MGITSVIRDSEGNILASLCAFLKKKLTQKSEPVFAECLALWRTLLVCADLGFQCVGMGILLRVFESFYKGGLCENNVFKWLITLQSLVFRMRRNKL